MRSRQDIKVIKDGLGGKHNGTNTKAGEIMKVRELS